MVVAITPVPASESAFAPLLAEIQAVGVPEALFKNANLAEAVDVPPIKTSAEFTKGEIAPLFNCQ